MVNKETVLVHVVDDGADRAQYLGLDWVILILIIGPSMTNLVVSVHPF